MMNEKKSLRQTILLQDFSELMKDKDFPPNRILCKFLDKYNENNPLSEIAFGLLRNKNCEFQKVFSDSNQMLISKIKRIIKELSFDDFNLNFHSSLKMNTIKENEPFGQLSILQGLQKSKELFTLSPLYYNKEIYIILGSGNSIDDQPIYDILEWFVEQKIRISIISISSSSFLFQQITKFTGGKIVFPQNQEDLEDYIFDIAEPYFLQNEKTFTTHIQVSFPSLTTTPVPIICMCHNKFINKGYKCSNCGVMNCNMPGQCILCGVKLISAAEIVRTTAGLHLEGKFKKIKKYLDKCYGCFQDENLNNQCQNCKKCYCNECCSLIKDDIRFCMGCLES